MSMLLLILIIVLLIIVIITCVYILYRTDHPLENENCPPENSKSEYGSEQNERYKSKSNNSESNGYGSCQYTNSSAMPRSPYGSIMARPPQEKNYKSKPNDSEGNENGCASFETIDLSTGSRIENDSEGNENGCAPDSYSASTSPQHSSRTSGFFDLMEEPDNASEQKNYWSYNTIGAGYVSEQNNYYQSERSYDLFRTESPEADSHDVVSDKVQFHGIAPSKIEKEEYALVKIMMYRDGDYSQVERVKKMMGEPLTETISSVKKVKRGTLFKVYLQSKDLELDDDYEEMKWNGDFACCDFSICIPADYTKKSILLIARVYKGDIRFVDLKLVIKIEASTIHQDYQDIEITKTIFKTIFASYAKLDKQTVINYLHVRETIKSEPDFFIENCNTWERVKSEIYNRDLFLLFWSRNARKSLPVMEQLRYALQVKDLDKIDAIPLENTNLCEPPEELYNQASKTWQIHYQSMAEENDRFYLNEVSLETEQLNCYVEALQKLITTQDNFGEKEENVLNDHMRNMIEMRNPQFQDQHRQGLSESGKSSGELDFLYKENGLQVSIGEALWMESTFSKDSSRLKTHIDKLVSNYDPIGLPYGFLIIYVKDNEGQGMNAFWNSFLKYMVMKYSYPDGIEETELIYEDISLPYANIRHASQVIQRSGKKEIIHFLASVIPGRKITEN